MSVLPYDPTCWIGFFLTHCNLLDRSSMSVNVPNRPLCDHFGGKYSMKEIFHKFRWKILLFSTFSTDILEKRGGLASLEEKREFGSLKVLL